MPSCPDPFLEVRVHDLSLSPSLTGLCAGYESREWRADQLAAHLIEWLPEFALTHKELESLGSHNAVRLLSRAAQVIYNTRTASPESRHLRGEIGELLLHVAIRQVFSTLPAISKFYYKDSANDTVKGFDAVHVIATNTSLELWLGEVKFYTDVNAAIRDVLNDIIDHTKKDYLKQEFAAITNKIDDSWPNYERLSKLLHPNTALDDVFDCMKIAVFLTYESPVVKSHSKLTAKYKSEFENELRKHYKRFCRKQLPENLSIHLFMLPLHLKKSLVEAFDRRLESCQTIGHK